MASLFLLLFAFGALLSSSNSQENNYNKLSESFKKGVDLALQKLHSHAGIQHHFVFFRSLQKSDIQSGFNVAYIYHHFYLRPTTCPKGTVDSKDCQPRNNRPLMDCAMCYKTLSDEIEPEPKPYVHCIHKTSLTQDMREASVEHCRQMGYSSGAPTLLSSRGTK